MSSSPGCLCRNAGTSGLSSTRFWMTMCPGMLRSCCCRSVRSIPGTCWTVVLMTKLLCFWLMCPPLAQRSERSPQFVGEQLRLFPGGEMAAPVDRVEVEERRVDLLDPAARRLEDLAGEGGEGDRHVDSRRSLGGATCCGLAVLPVRPRRRGAGAGQPVERDVVEDVISGEVVRGLVVDKGAGHLVVGVCVVVEHPRCERDR